MAMELQNVLARVGSGSLKKDGDAVIEGTAVPAMKRCRSRFAGLQLTAGLLVANA